MEKTAKMNIGAFMIVLMLSLPFATAEALKINDVAVKEVSDRYAIINWNTDQISSSEVKFGENITVLDNTKSNSKQVVNHTLVLNGLKAETKYFFNVSSQNDNGTSVLGPNEFTTALLDTIPPFISAEIPDFINKNTINIIGATEPNAEIYIYVDGRQFSTGFNVTSDDGIFSVNNVVIPSGIAGAPNPRVMQHTITISALDPARNRNEIAKTITVDTASPGITVDNPIPKQWSEKTLEIKGNSDESARITIAVTNRKNNKVFISLVNASSPWSSVITFPDTENEEYAIRIYAVDSAGNAYDSDEDVNFNRFISVDTRELNFADDNLDELSPSYVTERIIRGKMSKGGGVYVVALVNEKSTNDAIDFVNGRVEGISKVKGSIPLSVKEAWDRLSSKFTLSVRGISRQRASYIAEVNPDGTFEIPIQLESIYRIETADLPPAIAVDTGEAWKNDIELLAFDNGGNIIEKKTIVYYARCGAGGFFSISAPEPNPKSIPEPILKAGVSQLTLTMDLEWNGPTPEFEMSRSPVITKQALSQVDLRGKYNLSVGANGIMGTTTIYPLSVGPDTKQLYALINLKKTDHNFGPTNYRGDSAREFISELEFPLLIELEYTYDKPGGGRSDPIIQKKCINFAIQVEPAIDIFNKGDVKKGLLSAATWLKTQADNIDDILDITQNVQKWTMAICGAGIVVHYLLLLTDKITCKGKDFKEYLAANSNAIIYNNGQPECSTDSQYQDMLSCCKANLKSLKRQQVLVNTPCDRIFCPSVPSLSYHVNTYSDLIVKRPGTSSFFGVTTPSGGAVAGNRGAASRCADDILNPSAAGTGTDCEAEFQRAWGLVLPNIFGVNLAWPYKNVYDIAARKAGGEAETMGGFQEGFIRTSEFLERDMCASQDPNQVKIVSVESSDKDKQAAFMIYREKVLVEGDESFETKVAYGEYLKAISTTQEITAVSQGEVTLANPSEGVSQNNLVNVNSETSTSFKVIYPDLKFNRETGICSPRPEGSDCITAVSKLKGAQITSTEQYKLPPAVLSAVASAYSDKYVYSPTSSIVSATKSLCLPAINGYLITYRGLMRAVSRCFEDIALTGKGNTGACNALLSEVVCDLVIDAIMCVPGVLNKLGDVKGLGFGLGSTINPFKYISQAGSSITDTISGRYGDTQSYKTLFNENALLHSACIGALTGDWNLEAVSDLLSKASTVPVKSTCAVFPANRRFITSNPLKEGKTTYLYYAGGVLSAGADISNLRLELLCSNDNSCTRYPSSSNPRGECDCFGQPAPKTVQVPIATSSLKQGDVWDDAEYLSIPDAEFRYDKVRLTYSYKDNSGKNVEDKCESDLREDGLVPSTCMFTQIGFRCEFKIGDTGLAKFVGKPTTNNVENTYYVGDYLDLRTRIEVLSPKDTEISKFAKYVTRNSATNTEISDMYYAPKLLQGVNDYNYPDKKIETKHMGVVSEPIIKVNTGNKMTIAAGSATADVFASNTEFIVTFPDEKNYICSGVSFKDDRMVINKAGEKNSIADFSSGALVKCSNVQFRVLGDISKSVAVVGNNEFFDSYKGAAFHVQYTKAAGGSAQCNSASQDWSTEITLYEAVCDIGSDCKNNPSNWKMSRTPVYSEGKIQKETVNYKVVCKSFKTAEQGVAEVEVQEFEVSPATVKLGEDITVRWKIRAQPGAIKSLAVKIGENTPLALDTIDSGSRNVKIDYPSNLNYDVKLVINGVVDETKTNKLKVE